MAGQHVVGEGVAAEERLRVIRTRADKRDRCVGGQRKHALRFAEQDDGALGEPAGDVPIARRVEVDGPGRFRSPVLVQEAQLRLLPQHPPDRAVDELLVDRAGPDLVEQVLAVAERVGQLDVDPGAQRECARIAVRGGHAVHRREERDRPVVGHDGALETPVVAQDSGEQGLVGTGGDAVDVVVGVHESTAPPRTT